MKRLLVICLIVVMVVTLTACNMQIIDTTWSYEKAIITLPGGESIEGRVESWCEYESSDMLQVKIGGKQYLTHSANVVLISED